MCLPVLDTPKRMMWSSNLIEQEYYIYNTKRLVIKNNSAMIYVFKTSVFAEDDMELLKPTLEELPHTRWKFDLEDCDNILSIDAPTEISEIVISSCTTKVLR